MTGRKPGAAFASFVPFVRLAQPAPRAESARVGWDRLTSRKGD